MALIEYTLEGKENKVETAIKRFKAFEPPEGYFLAFSGGKDSVVIKRLAEMAGVKFDAHYSVTSVDPPELVRFVKEQKDVSFDIPRDKDGNAITMWNLIPKKKMPPTRIARYCCEKLKECAGEGRLTVTGIRWAESVGRKKNGGMVSVVGGKREQISGVESGGKITDKGGVVLNFDNSDARRFVEHCYRTSKTTLNPIIIFQRYIWSGGCLFPGIRMVAAVSHIGCHCQSYRWERTVQANDIQASGRAFQ